MNTNGEGDAIFAGCPVDECPHEGQCIERGRCIKTVSLDIPKSSAERIGADHPGSLADADMITEDEREMVNRAKAERRPESFAGPLSEYENRRAGEDFAKIVHANAQLADRVTDFEEQLARVAKRANQFREALKLIAKQKTVAEIPPKDMWEADFQGAYDEFIRTAREVLSPLRSTDMTIIGNTPEAQKRVYSETETYNLMFSAYLRGYRWAIDNHDDCDKDLFVQKAACDYADKVLSGSADKVLSPAALAPMKTDAGREAALSQMPPATDEEEAKRWEEWCQRMMQICRKADMERNRDTPMAFQFITEELAGMINRQITGQELADLICLAISALGRKRPEVAEIGIDVSMSTDKSVGIKLEDGTIRILTGDELQRAIDAENPERDTGEDAA